MLANESRAVADVLAAWPDDAFPVGYLASGAVADGRGDVGHDAALAAIRARGARLVTHEFRPAPGVDLAGDLLDPETWLALTAAGCRSFLATNLLEHLADRSRFVALIQGSLPVGGRLLVTVPGRYPYHPDPIDTMYRPSPAELALEFPLLVAESATSTVEVPAVSRLVREPAAVARKLAKALRARRADGPRTDAPVGTAPAGSAPGGTAPGGPSRSSDLSSGLLPARVSIVSFVKPAR